ncbi:MAG: XTP/dITP diphosphatase [bacterium]|nr:XTP/dITP diphosphatase [candidate division KSB1 bacterium]MDH7559046.1 XTP/dITP diphosphatase [bacterium]
MTAKKLVLATRNMDKVREMRQVLADVGWEVLSLEQFPEVREVVEDGTTIEANAIKKALVIAQHTGLVALADDTGLEVAALGGAPGVCSSRYAGPGATYADNVRKLLRDLDGVPEEQRAARFRCVIAIAEDERVQTVEGVCEGRITMAPRGNGGFGYDPVFLVPQLGLTFAEMSLAQKNALSHRGQALRQAKAVLATWKTHEQRG